MKNKKAIYNWFGHITKCGGDKDLNFNVYMGYTRICEYYTTKIC